MDKQFYTLARSYTDNYIQYEVTGAKSHQIAYKSAEEGIQRILQSLKKEEETPPEPEEPKITLHEQRDLKAAAEMRQPVGSIVSNHTTQYVILGLLTASIIGFFMI